MKIITISGTRPDLIRLSEIIKRLDQSHQQIFVHAGQNFTAGLRDEFFKDLNLRQPDYQYNLTEQSTGFDYIGKMMVFIEEIIKKRKPERALILGDTNSALAAYVCKQMHLPVFHLEAGNRCYDDNVPEEVNRRIIDTCSEYLLTYTQRSREQLLAEGYPPQKIIVVGNPITEIVHKHFLSQKINYQPILKKYQLTKNSYLVATLHRTENVTNRAVLKKITDALNQLAQKEKIILSVHPKLKTMLDKTKIRLHRNIIQSEPFGFKEFLSLVKNARVVLTDSGTVPEECCLLKIPCVLMRNTTERPELLENNSMVLSGTATQSIIDCYNIAKKLSIGQPPTDYQSLEVSEKIVKIVSRLL